MTFVKTIWTYARWERAKQLRDDGYGDAQIGERLGLTEKQVRSRFANMHYCARTATKRISEAPAFAERDRRAAAPLSLTSKIMGDPPPGYSALDQKRREGRG